MALPAKGYAKDLDEIVNYTIKVDVNEDATLTMTYHIDWKVLDSTSEGPLSWVLIGIPNKEYKEIKANSDCIKKIAYNSSNGSCVRIDLDRDYKKDEIVPIEFILVQDYMYQMDLLKECETVYQFTPGWFDEIQVDNLEIRWASDKVIEASPAYIEENGYYVWTSSLAKGEKYKVQVTYPNDAFKFDDSKKIEMTTSSSSAPDSNGVEIGALCCPFTSVVSMY
jgi:hypothetical protein